jgi:hypothetical protein
MNTLLNIPDQHVKLASQLYRLTDNNEHGQATQVFVDAVGHHWHQVLARHLNEAHEEIGELPELISAARRKLMEEARAYGMLKNPALTELLWDNL